MSFNYYEQRPPRVAAMRLDFLGDDADQVVAKLREMPGVYDVSVQYGDEGKRKFIINPNVTKGRLEPDFWLVSIPNDTTFDDKVYMLSDSEFNAKYRGVDKPPVIGTFNYNAGMR